MSGHEEFVAAGILEEGEGEDLLLEILSPINGSIMGSFTV